MLREKLRLGLLLDSYQVPAWTYRALESVACSQHATLCLVVLNDRRCIDGPQGIGGNAGTILYRVFSKLDKRIFGRGPDASETRDLASILAGRPVLKVTSIQDGDSCHFERLDVQSIQAYKLDILVHLGFGNLTGDILQASRYGVWAYWQGRNSGAIPGFWEVVDGQPETISGLLVLSEPMDNHRVIHRSCLPTFPFSPARNRNRCLWASSAFLSRQLTLLHHLGEDRFFARANGFARQLDVQGRGNHAGPSNGTMLRVLPKLVARNLRETYLRMSRLDTWYLMYHLGGQVLPPVSQCRKVMPPKDRFWADPHIVRRDETYYIFIEEYIYEKGKAHISVIEMDSRGHYKSPISVLEQTYHLSYPMVFEWQDRYFMVPESAANRTIDLYECIEFPHRWEYRLTLMEDVVAVDSTLFCHDGKWWLFTGIADPESTLPHVELFLFFSGELFTNNWCAHPLNPLVSDVRRARPAGRIFRRGAKIFRPSQDGSKLYGFGFDLNEILRLSETEYEERTVASMRPDWDLETEATHTFASEGELTVIDAFVRRGKGQQSMFAPIGGNGMSRRRKE
jgi:hypothetical protein